MFLFVMMVRNPCAGADLRPGLPGLQPRSRPNNQRPSASACPNQSPAAPAAKRHPETPRRHAGIVRLRHRPGARRPRPHAPTRRPDAPEHRRRPPHPPAPHLCCSAPRHFASSPSRLEPPPAEAEAEPDRRSPDELSR
jgi:hypothetical protein